MTITRSVISLSVIGATTLAAQSPGRTFEVASVRRVAPDTPGLPIVGVVNGRLTAPSATLRDLMQAAFAIEQAQIIGGPTWADRDRFAVNAVVPPGAAVADVREMLRTLLVERFRLVTQRESREVPAYVLETTGRVGSGLRQATAECSPLTPPRGATPAVPPTSPPPALAAMTVLNLPPGGLCRSVFLNGHISARSMPTGSFAAQLGRVLRQLVVDRTGLVGMYDFDVSYTVDQTLTPAAAGAVVTDATALAVAIRDQLGLRLEYRRIPADVIVIAGADPPSEN